MGLDITYHGEAVPVDCTDNAGETYCEREGHVRVWNNRHFLGREAPLEVGRCYRVSRTDGLPAGSYGGYNRWRERLASLVGVTPREVWASPEAHADTPFVEQINFSDCEGMIGPAVARELAKDYADHDAKAQQQLDEVEYAKYREWRKAFETAANGGIVEFH